VSSQLFSATIFQPSYRAGASTGLGLALVRRILARGDCVIATARSTDKLNTTFADVKCVDRERLRSLALDVVDTFENLKDIASVAISYWGHVDVIVNNAALVLGLGVSEEIGYVTPFSDASLSNEPPCCSAENFAVNMATNFQGVINVTNAFLPYIRARREGTIIIVGSRSAVRNELVVRSPLIYSMYCLTMAQGITSYSAPKAAVHCKLFRRPHKLHSYSTLLLAYGESLAEELRPFNIRVTILVPGTMRTRINHPRLAPGRFSDYDDSRAVLNRWTSQVGNRPIWQTGDPLKAMDVVVDVVHGEGRAKGREGWPLWLLLGEDAVADWKARAERMLKNADEWGDLAAGLAHDPPTCCN